MGSDRQGSGGPDQFAQLVHPLRLGHGAQPAADHLCGVDSLPRVPAEEGVDGHAQGAGDGGEELHIREAAFLPLAHRLGGDPYHLSQLFLGEAPLFAERGDALIQQTGHPITSFRLMVVL